MCMMHTANKICGLKSEIAANLLRNMFVASTVVDKLSITITKVGIVIQ